MSSLLRDSLRRLNTALGERDVFEANLLVKDIDSVFSGRLSASELDLSCALLFKSPECFLNFIRKSNAHNEFAKCQDACLGIIQNVLSSLAPLLQQYVESIADTCINVFRASRASSNKEKCLGIIIMLVKMRDTHGHHVNVTNIRKLCNEELAKSKTGTTSSVKGCCFHLHGVIAQYYPEEMIEHSERMFNIYLRELKKEFGKSSDHKIIEGCLKGLCCLMVHFSKTVKEDPDTCSAIFKYTLTSIQPKIDLARYAVPIAGLQMIQKHSSQFGRLLVERYDDIYKALQKWFSHNNNQMKHEAHVAISSFLREIASALDEGGDAIQVDPKRLFTYFVSKFQEILESSDSNSKSLSLAIQGYGMFATLCRKYMPDGYVAKMLSVMMDRSVRVYLGSGKEKGDGGENQLHQLPSFLFSLGNIAKEVVNCTNNADADVEPKFIITESFQRSLCRLCVHMIKEFPYLNKKFASSCCSSLVTIMAAFSSRPSYQKIFTSEIVYQGIIRSCSMEASDYHENDDAFVSVDESNILDIASDARMRRQIDYVDLWKGMISPTEKNSSMFYAVRIDKSESEITRKMIFNELLNAVISIVSKLNLNINESAVQEDSDITDDMSQGIENVSDFQLFSKLCDLFQKLLPDIVIPEYAKHCTKDIFEQRACDLVKVLIKESTRFPTVSGYYDLLGTIMKIFTEYKYFVKSEPETGDDDEMMDWSQTSESTGNFTERIQCMRLLKKFVNEVSTHVMQWQGDVLNSSLLFLLSLPSDIATDILDVLVKPMQMAFRLGLTFTPLAEAGMSAIERWRTPSSSTIPKPLVDVLPDIEPFLHVKFKKDSQNFSIATKRRKNVKQHNFKMESTALQKIHDQVIRFLGSIGDVAYGCLDNKEKSDDRVSTWSKGATVKYSVPFQELKLDIQLESFIPRVAELALQSATRQTKVTACELLHSLTVYVIGKSAHQDEAIQTQYPLTGIYEYIIPVVLKLACDAELVTRQLFEPLAMQMIHWFTNNRKYESADTVVLLNSVMNGLVDETNGSLREFSARCVEEFLTWSIKQDSGRANTGRKNAKSIFKRLYNLARHPSTTKRFGSAMAFNHIYKIYREQEALVDEFTFELLVTYVDSLSMSQEDNNALGTKTACIQALRHLQRIVNVKKDLFGKESKIRRVPPGFQRNESIVLHNIIEWLLEQCGRPHTECRHICMELLFAFIPLLPKTQSPAYWIKNYVKEKGMGKLIACFEGDASRTGIAMYPQISLTLKDVKLKSLMYWFDLFLSSLDCYTWIVQQKLLSPSELFAEKRSNLFQCIDYFLRDVTKCDLHEFISEADVFTPKECDEFSEKRCTVIVRIFQFVTLMFRQHSTVSVQLFPSNLMEEDSLLGVVSSCLVDPSSLGFNIESDIAIAEQLPPLISEIVGALHRSLAGEIKKNFVERLRSELLKPGTLSEQLEFLQDLNMEKLSHLVSAYQILAKTKVLFDVLPEIRVGSDCGLGQKVVVYVFNSVVEKGGTGALVLSQPSHQRIQLGKTLLKLALELGVSVDFLVGLISDSTVLYDDAENQLGTSHGQHFFSMYKSLLCGEICNKSSLYIPVLTKKSSSYALVETLNELLEFLFNDRQARKRYSIDVCKNILNVWTTNLSGLWKSLQSSADTKSMIITVFTKIISLNAKICTNTEHTHYKLAFQVFSDMITSSLPLTLKAQVLTTLSLFCLVEDEQRQNELKSTLFDLCSMHFPSKSTEFSPGSNQYEEYVATVNKLLYGLEMSGSVNLLEILISIFCKEENHVLADDFQQVLEKCLQSVLDAKQLRVLDVPYKLFSGDESPHPTNVRCRIVNVVLLPLLTKCTGNAAQEFFSSHIGNIMHSIMEDHKRYPIEVCRDQLAVKSCNYKLVEVMFKLLPCDQFKVESSPLVQAFASSTIGAGSTKFLKTFMGKVVRDKHEDTTHESDLVEERRLFHCAVYNAIIAAVTCTQTEVKWFDVFIFSENPKKKEFLFDNIIDKTKSYLFPVMMDEPNQRKKIFSVRQANRDHLKATNENYESVMYMSSLAGSSLSADVDRFDNNSSLVIQQESQHTATIPAFKAESSREVLVELERDEMNDHECMENLIALLAHMQSNGIGFPASDEEQMETNQKPPPPTLQKWMNSLIQKLNSPTHLNVKIFILKLIINCESIFQPFASHLLTPLIKVILSYFKRNQDAGDMISEIDQLIVDATVMVLSWSPIAIPKDDTEDKILVRALLEYLMKSIKGPVPAIFRRNLDLIKTLIECWKERIDNVNTDIIFNYCSCTDNKSLDNQNGLQLLAAVLINGLPPYTPSTGPDREEFFQRIFNNLLSSRKAIVDVTAEIVGLSLKHLYDVQHETEGFAFDLVRKLLEKMSTTTKSGVSGLGVFITSLHKVAKHYPPVAVPFLKTILFNLPKLPGAEIKTSCIDILCLCVDKADDLLAELKAKDFISMLIHRDEGLQYSCLKLCMALVQQTVVWKEHQQPNIDEVKSHQETVDYFLSHIGEHFAAHPSSRCRQELYNIAMYIYDIQKGFSAEHQSNETLKIVKTILMGALNDQEEFLRTQVTSFMCEDRENFPPRLPSNPAVKVVEVLRDLYQVGVEESGFLSSCCNMLMQAASKSPDFERPVFENPLSECAFQELNFGDTWRRGSFGTKFEETMRSTIISSSFAKSSLVSGAQRAVGRNVLQATQQDLQFTATLADPGPGRSSYNWMTGESLDTFADFSSDVQQGKFNPRGANAIAMRQKQFRKPNQPVGPGFGRQMQGQNKKDSQALDLQRLRRRIQKETSANRYKFARIATRTQEAKKRSQHKEELKREHAVQVYRSYRIGELPDIQIPHRGLIVPLTALAQHDSVFLQRFMSSTINAILKEQCNKEESTEYVNDLSKAFANVLESSQQCDSAFIGCILNVIHQNAAIFNVAPNIISQAALKSGQRDLGICAIEEWLIQKQAPQEPSSKRRKLISEPVASSEDEILAYVELARLYGEDSDTLRGIFTETPIARSLFGEVLMLETHGEFRQASKIYQKALSDDLDPVPSDVEKDLWEDRLVNCLENLGRWQSVNRFCDAQFDESLETAWASTHLQGRFLGTALHAKLILLLRGDDGLLDEMMHFISNAIKHGEHRKQTVEKEYSNYIAMLHIYQEDYDSARYYLKKSMEGFSEKWGGKQLDEETGSLNALYSISDMMDFVDFVKGIPVADDQAIAKANQLTERWITRLPHKTHDNMRVWEDMVIYRYFLMDQIEKKVSSILESQDGELSVFKHDFVEKKISLILNATEQACGQKHFALAREFLNEQAETVIGSTIEDTELVSLGTSSYYLTFADHLVTFDKEGSQLLKASKAIVESHSILCDLEDKQRENAGGLLQPKYYTLLGRTFELAIDVLNNESCDTNSAACLGTITSAEEDDKDAVKRLLKERGLKCFNEGVDAYTTLEKNMDIAQMYLNYAKFCDKLLQTKETDFGSTSDTEALESSESFAKSVIKYVLRTMKSHDSNQGKEASLKYPRLLQLIETYPGDAKSCFLSETSQVPTWMFLRWISQMIALLDKSEADAIHQVISRLAETYPQAVVYPLKTSLPDFKFTRDDFGKRNKSFVEKLHSGLDSRFPIVESFIKNLELLTNPAHTFKEWSEDARNILTSKDKAGWQSLIFTNYQNMYNSIFGAKNLRADDEDQLYGTRGSSPSIETYKTKFTEAFREKVKKAFGGETGGQILLDMKKFHQAAGKLTKEMVEYCRSKQPNTLKEYSKWLFDFNSLSLDDQELEIPGQYKGLSMPLPKYHAKIVGFDDNVKIMTSLQQPKKITIKASDCKNYQYLLKGNEDLRQDQRIQQLFEAMNMTFQQDPFCCKRKMHLITYQVVPITSRLGLIEWVDKTQTLYDVILGEAKRINKSSCLDKAYETYRLWLQKFGNVNRPPEPYINMMKKANYAQACASYQDVLSQLPKDLLRNAYLKLSSSPQKFLALRKEFAVSYGTLCAAHWILGIGDRHTSNCMIALDTGAAVGIDFGHAFGTATELLSVPELVPFRLSPQICFLLAPHPAKNGLLRQIIMFCITALRTNRKSILTMLDIFLKEPSVDWMKHAKKMARNPGLSQMDSTGRLSSVDSARSSHNIPEDTQWYPIRKIDIVKKKLSGHHPSSITRDELERNFSISKVRPFFAAVAKGVDGKCTRTKFTDEILSVDDQVDCLIDQATDPNILGRTYSGWRFWL